METKKQYIERLEDEFFENLMKSKVRPLLEEFKSNGFETVSEAKMMNLGKINVNALQVEKKVKKQKTALGAVIGKIKEFAFLPISENLQQKFFILGKTLLEQTTKFGYCEESCELLKIIKGKEFVGDFAGGNADREILEVISAYGKRAILEDDEQLVEDAEHLLTDVCTGLYGETKLSVAQMDKALNSSAVVKGTMVFPLRGEPYKIQVNNK
ncbi:MAG: hypothetical protein J6K39_00900 [Clostridia bacterium]|nr:hypothetical protein [Clostridia bacterium]